MCYYVQNFDRQCFYLKKEQKTTPKSLSKRWSNIYFDRKIAAQVLEGKMPQNRNSSALYHKISGLFIDLSI
jgi:hypothetical protein